MKTSLTACLAVHAAELGKKVAVVDLDPQGSLSRWWALRKKPKNPRLLVEPRNLMNDVQLLKSGGWQVVILDTPPGDVELVADAIRAADFALIPTRVSALDVIAVEPAVDACERAGRPFGFVLTAYDPKWSLSSTAGPYLRKRGQLLEPPIQYRAAYAAAMTVGRTGPESEDRKQAKACRDEIAALWKAIEGAAP